MTELASHYTQGIRALETMIGSLGKDLGADRELFKFLPKMRIIPWPIALENLGRDEFGHAVIECAVERKENCSRKLVSELLPRIVQSGLSVQVMLNDSGPSPQRFSFAFGRLWALLKHQDPDFVIGLSEHGETLAPRLPSCSEIHMAPALTYSAFNNDTFPPEIRKAMRLYLKSEYGLDMFSAALRYDSDNSRPCLIPNVAREAFGEKDAEMVFLQSLVWFLPRRYPIGLLSQEELSRPDVQAAMGVI